MRLNNPAAKYMIASEKKPNKANELWTHVKDRYDIGIELRRPFEREWLLNLAFLTGKQYVFFNMHTHTLHQLQRIKGKIRNVDNKLLPRWRRQIADLIKNQPIMSVVPNTHEDEDIKAARIGDKVLQHFWRQAKMQKKLRLLAGWVFATGTAGLDDRWNTKLGQVELDPKTGKAIYTGDAECSVWSPFDILVPYATVGDDNHQAFPWLIKMKHRTLEELVDVYGTDAKEVQAERYGTPSVDLSGLLGLGTTGSAAATKVPGALEINYYEKPNSTHTRGLFIAAANGKILTKSDYPFPDYSIEFFKDIDIPGVFWGTATLSQAIGLQRTWNRTLSSIDEYNRVMAKGKGLTPRGANMVALPDDTHGEWIEYTPVYGHKPEHMDLKGLPQTYPLIMEHTYGAIEDLFSQHEVTRGTNRSDIRSGEMVSLLREQDAHGNIPAHAVFEESLESTMSRVLKRIQAGYKDERMLKIVGREGEFEIFAFKGADLRGNTDVLVKKQSSLPESRAARSAQVMERFEKGLYGDPMDPEVRRHVMNMLDDAVVKDIYSTTRLDEAYARYENMFLSSGQADPKSLINSYDNHALHILEHNNYEKSMEHQKLKLDDPDKFNYIEQLFLAHKIVHQEFLSQQQAEMLATQTQSKGGPK